MKDNVRKKGSVLIFSLIILFMIIMIALGVASVASIEKKNILSSNESITAFQIAESGTELFLNQIKGLDPSTTYLSALGTGWTCDTTTNSITRDLAEGKYEIIFEKEDESKLLCTDFLAAVKRVKSVGTYGQTTRAVDVLVNQTAPFEFVQTYASSAGTDNSVVLNNVGAGHLIVIWLKWESNTSSLNDASVSDGTSSFARGTRKDLLCTDGGYMHAQFAYLLVANSGNRTYTVTWPSNANADRKTIIAAEYSYSGTAVLDKQSTGGEQIGTSLQSGNITTTGTNELVLGGGANYDGNITWSEDHQINDTPADGSKDTDYGLSFSKNTMGTMHAQVSMSSPTDPGWICNIISFKAN